MTEVISVRFKSKGKLYYFAPNGITVPDKTNVVVETAKGLELGECLYGNHWVDDEKVVPPLRPVIRIATEDDLRVARVNKGREKEAFEICQKKIAAHGLDMKLVDVECNFEGNKIIFFFASEGRVDFRELVKDLASVFRTRIELRQIGVRDEAKMLGGLGICGRPFCCSQFLDDFAPVSTKMAKTQSMSLNPTKISGSCGRLMCCLRYEQEAYEELVKNVPKNGAFVQTPQGYGNVTQINLLRQKIKVKLDGAEQSIKTFEVDEVATVPGGRPKPGEPLPVVLKAKAEPAIEEEPVIVNAEPAVEAEPEAAPRPQKAAEKRPMHFSEKRAEDAENETEHKPQRRRGRGGRGKPRPTGEAAENREVKSGEAPKAQQGGERKNKGRGKPQQSAEKKAQPQPAAEKKPQQEGAPAKKNEGRRRYYHRRGKSSGGNKAE